MAKEPRENRVPIMMSDEEVGAIDDWRFSNRVATRSDAVRRLAQLGLALSDRLPSMLSLYRRANAETNAVTNEQLTALITHTADRDADPSTRLAHLKAYTDHTFSLEEVVLELCREVLLLNHGNELAGDTSADIEGAIEKTADLRKLIATVYPSPEPHRKK